MELSALSLPLVDTYEEQRTFEINSASIAPALDLFFEGCKAPFMCAVEMREDCTDVT